MSYTVDDAKEILKEAGVSFIEGRFPYTYSYDWMRAHLWTQYGTEMSRADCAVLVTQKCEEEGISKDQGCMAGALIYLLYNERTTALSFANSQVLRDLFDWAMKSFGPDCEKVR